MLKKSTLFFAAFLAATTLLAQWAKPSLPAKKALALDEVVYLFNPGAEGFFLGANDWYTRASISPTRGYKVTIEKYVTETTTDWDGKS